MGGVGEVRNFYSSKDATQVFFPSCAKNIAISTWLEPAGCNPDGPAGEKRMRRI